MADTPKTYVGFEQVSSICSTGHPAAIMTGAIVQLLRNHFASAPDISFNPDTYPRGPNYTEYVWTNDPRTTHIQIEPLWRWSSVDIQRRPALMVKRNAITAKRFAINNGWMVGGEYDEDELVRMRGPKYSTVLVGSHTVFCAGGTGDEAENLGQEVFEQLLEFGPILRTDLKLHRWDSDGVGPVGKLEEFKEIFYTPVSCRWATAHTWRLTPIAPWLKTINAEITPA